MKTVIYIVILFTLFSLVYMYFMKAFIRKKKEKATRDFNFENQKQNAPAFLEEALSGDFAFVREDLKGKTIEAFAECTDFKTMGQQVGKVVKDAAKQELRKMVTGTYAGSSEQQSYSLLVLSGNDLLLLRYHKDLMVYTFSKDQVMNGSIRKLDKISIKSKAYEAGYNEYVLTIENNQGKFEILIYDFITVQSGGLNALWSDGHYQNIVKLDIIADLFKKTFEKKYPNMSFPLM